MIYFLSVKEAGTIKGIEIIRIDKANIDSLSSGLSELSRKINDIAIDPSYWRWRYVDNPFNKTGTIAALKDGRVVGKLGLVYSAVTAGGQRVLSGVMEGLAVEPAERSWASFSAMIRKSIEVSMQEAVGFCFSFTTEPAADVVGRMGAEIIGRMPIFSGLLSGRKAIEGRGVPFPLSLAGRAAEPFIGVRNRKSANSDIEIKPINSFDKRFDALWKETAGSGRIAIIKDAAYLNWRYVKCPVRKYAVLAAYRDKDLTGFIVYMNWPKKNDGFILELISKEGEETALRSLLHTALVDLKRRGVGLVSASFPENSSATRALLDSNFKPWGSKYWNIQMTVATTGKRGSAPELDFSNWDFSLGDWLFH